jgi:hypothetical protein
MSAVTAGTLLKAWSLLPSADGSFAYVDSGSDDRQRNIGSDWQPTARKPFYYPESKEVVWGGGGLVADVATLPVFVTVPVRSH